MILVATNTLKAIVVVGVFAMIKSKDSIWATILVSSSPC